MAVPTASRISAPPAAQGAIAPVAPIHFCDFADELLAYFFSLLGSPQDVNALSLTCRQLHMISTDDVIWKPFCLKYFPEAKAPLGYFSLCKEMRTFKDDVRFGIYQTRTLPVVHEDSPSSCFKISNGLLFIGYQDGTVEIREMESGTCLKSFPAHAPWISTLEIANGLLFAASNHAKALMIWDIETGECLASLEDSSGIRDLAVFGTSVITADDDKKLCLYDFSDPRKAILLSSVQDQRHTAGQLPPPQVRGCYYQPGEGKFTSVAFANGFIFTGSSDREIKIWDVSDLQNVHCIQTLQGPNEDHTHEISCLLVHKDRLFAGLHNSQVKVWDISDVNQAKCIQTFNFSRYAVDIQVSRGCLFVGLRDGTVEILDSNTWKSLRTIKPIKSSTSFQVVENRLLAGGGNRDPIKIWDFCLSQISPYTLSQLEENLKILGEMATLEHRQDYDGLVKLIETAEKELHPDFQQRIEECAKSIVFSSSPGASKQIGKEVILQVQAELCVEIMLHSIRNQNWERVHQLLDQLQFIARVTGDPMMNKLYELLWIEAGKPDKWGFGENAFYDREGCSATIENKFQAALKFREFLKARYPRSE